MTTHVPGKQRVPSAETWAVKDLIKKWPGAKPLTIVADASYIVKGFLSHSREAYLKWSNGDFWNTIYKRDEAVTIKPAVAKIRNHVSSHETKAMMTRHTDFVMLDYVNEAADVAPDAAADRQGDHNEALKREGFSKARLWKILCRLSAIEQDIREVDESVPISVKDIVVAAEAHVGGRIKVAEAKQ